MNTSLQDKLDRMKEERIIDAFKDRLSSFECGAYFDTTEFPQTLATEIQRANKIDTPRASKMLCSEGRDKVFSWVEEMFKAAGVNKREFYLLTPFRFYPWLQCKALHDEWVKNLSDIKDLNVSVVSSDKKRFLCISNEENWLDAYWSEI